MHYLILSRAVIVNPHKSSMFVFFNTVVLIFFFLSLLSCSGPYRITGRDVMMRMFCRILTEKLFSWGVIGKKRRINSSVKDLEWRSKTHNVCTFSSCQCVLHTRWITLVELKTYIRMFFFINLIKICMNDTNSHFVFLLWYNRAKKNLI